MSLYLGLDSSTQGVKAILIDPSRGEIVATHSVNFGRDLPSYECPGGFLANPDPLVKHADPLLWLAALDLLLSRMQAAGVPLAEVAGIGGDGQQHGSVYLNAKFPEIVGALDPAAALADQLAPAFSRRTAPIWMDSSTSAECAEITSAIGDRLQSATGSPAIERFTGPQIRRFYKTDPAGYANTTRVHLVSSFLCSVLIGADAPIDTGDGAGMNLLNLNSLEWDPEIAKATAPGLLGKLPSVAAKNRVAGGLASYFSKYGLKSGTPVAVWTGDNPASLVGSGSFRPGVAVVSLGTSDTFFSAIDPYRVDPEGFGHVFGHPAGGFMCLACFKNGSLARERVRTEAGVDWKFFDQEAFALTPAGNNGRWALPWFEPEITPLVASPGLRANFDFEGSAPEVRIRAVVEAQALSLRSHSLWIGNFKTLRVTGGASNSPGILQTLADVFDATVETISTPDSAALGGAMIAAHTAGGVPYESLATSFCPAKKKIPPNESAAKTYQSKIQDFLKFEKSASAPAVSQG